MFSVFQEVFSILPSFQNKYLFRVLDWKNKVGIPTEIFPLESMFYLFFTQNNICLFVLMLTKCQSNSPIYFIKAKLNLVLRAWLLEKQVTFFSVWSKSHIHELNISDLWKCYLEILDFILITSLQYLHAQTENGKSFLKNKLEVWSNVLLNLIINPLQLVWFSFKIKKKNVKSTDGKC